MQPRDRAYLAPMMDVAIEAHCLALRAGPDGWVDDRSTPLAVTHLVQTLGEAARRFRQTPAPPIPRCLGANSSACGTRSFTTNSTWTSMWCGR